MNILKTLSLNIAVFFLSALLLVSAAQAQDDTVWIDVRSAEEFATGHLEGARNIPHTAIADEINALELDKDTEINLYCRSGTRAGIAKQALEALGYSHVNNVGSLEDARKINSQ